MIGYSLFDILRFAVSSLAPLPDRVQNISSLSATSWPSGSGPMLLLALAAAAILLLILFFRWIFRRSR